MRPKPPDGLFGIRERETNHVWYLKMLRHRERIWSSRQRLTSPAHQHCAPPPAGVLLQWRCSRHPMLYRVKVLCPPDSAPLNRGYRVCAQPPLVVMVIERSSPVRACSPQVHRDDPCPRCRRRGETSLTLTVKPSGERVGERASVSVSVHQCRAVGLCRPSTRSQVGGVLSPRRPLRREARQLTRTTASGRTRPRCLSFVVTGESTAMGA